MRAAFSSSSSVGSWITSGTGRYKAFPVAGGALMLAGMLLLSSMDTSTSRTEAALYMAVLGAGLGCLLQVVMLVSQNSVDVRDIGVASAAITLFRMLGRSFGVAVMGALFNRRVLEVMAERAPGRPALAHAQLDAAGLTRLQPAVQEAYRHATAAGTHSAFLVGSLAGALALLAGLLVREVALRTTASSGASRAPLGRTGKD